MNSTDDLRAVVAGMDENSPPDEFVAVQDAIGSAKAELAALSKQFDAMLVAHLEIHGDIEIGPIRLYVGRTKKHRVDDKDECVRTLLESGGPEAIVACMKPEWFNIGPLRQFLDNDIERHVRTEFVLCPETGKPKRGPKRANAEFITKAKAKTGTTIDVEA